MRVDTNWGGGLREYVMALSKREARRTLAQAMVAIGRARDPAAEFSSRQQAIEDALNILGRELDPRRFLAACGVAASAVTVPEEGDAPASLPPSAEAKVRQLLARDLEVQDVDGVEIVDVRGGPTEGYSFRIAMDEESLTAFAVEYRGHWVLAPGPIGREELDAVTAAFRRHFDFFVAMGLHHKGVDDAAIASMREQVVPERALWPDESDPREVCKTHALVFRLTNPTGNGRRFYCGYDPMTGGTEPYDFG